MAPDKTAYRAKKFYLIVHIRLLYDDGFITYHILGKNMFQFLKKGDHKPLVQDQQTKPSWLERLKRLAPMFRSPSTFSDGYLEELETALLLADVGAETTEHILHRLKRNS